MSYNVGVYTAPSGAETAFAGEVIASATWNAINTDYATALNQIGYPSVIAGRIAVNLNAAATDFPIQVPLLPGFTQYRVTNLVLTSPSLPTAANAAIGLYTAASGGGTVVIGSTTLTINNSPGSATSVQVVSPSIVNTVTLTVSVLYLRVLVSASGTNCSATLFAQSLS